MKINPAVLQVLPTEIIIKYGLLPLAFDENTLTVAVGEALDWQVLDDLRQLTGKRIIVKQLPTDEISINLNRFLFNHDKEEVVANSIISFVDKILVKAVKEKASDLHFEAEENAWRIRLRIDGILIELVAPPGISYLEVVSRLKILAGLDISKKKEPLEGRFRRKIANSIVDFRLVAIPALYGEKIVIRILDKERMSFDLNQLGLAEVNLVKITKLLARPQGLILISGPTGSGKTTTIYSMLQHLKSSEKSLTTLEDPIEYTLSGITQISIEGKLTFGGVLKSLLRQDPDIIMIGEIRDQETAQIALRAATTGHLVLASIHTTTAPQGVSRLIDLGVEPYLIRSGLVGLLCQRLVRKKCACIAGCTHCNLSGYRGRTIIQEVVEVTPRLVQLIHEQFDEQQFIRTASQEGYRPLMLEAERLCAEGITDQQEIARVIYSP
ncbi:MAG: GspE/PulE family protein [Bacillota bacterium]|nr:GspE/PulE family protein [Bacillota bacterium]